jgi:transposase InsO family protein
MIGQTTQEQRCRFYRRHICGETYPDIAESEKVSKECVRYWCRRQRAGGSCQSQYRRTPAGLLSRFDPKVGYVILRLRLRHPRWGPNRILNQLLKRPSLKGLELPGESSIGRYLHQWKRFRRRHRKEMPHERPRQAKRVHQRWQIDFKMEIRLKDGDLVNLCTLHDPVGEACIGALVFPAGKAKKRGVHVTFEQVRSALRICFARWGVLPNEVQSDHEPVFVGRPRYPFPSRFTLWLRGLGIIHLTTCPGRPTDNAEVERCHRTIHDYAIAGNEDQGLAGLQAILDQAVDELCGELTSRAEGCHGLPPLQAHPELRAPHPPFQPEHELALFNMPAVDTYLASFTWERKVGKTGQFTLGGQRERYSVGRTYACQSVLVRFDPADRHFVFYSIDQPEVEIGRRPARNLELSDLTGIAFWPIGLGPQQLPLPLPFFQGVNC